MSFCTYSSRCLAGLLLVGYLGSVAALEVPAPPSPSSVETRLSGEFAGFAGSPDNATALVRGLHGATPVTLLSGGPAPVAMTFAPPTRPMGYGNVRIALALARADLTRQGIANPSTAEIRGALIGSGGRTGILQQRADGLGWGKIAQRLGFKLGKVVGSRGPAVSTGHGHAAGMAKAANSHHANSGAGIFGSGAGHGGGFGHGGGGGGGGRH